VELKTCPAPDCDRSIATRQVLCPDHLNEVPPDLRKQLQALKQDQGSEAFQTVLASALANIES